MRNSNTEESCRVVVVSPHPDDAELGCGGAIAKHILTGNEVYVLILSEGEKAGIERIAESKEGLMVLGVKEVNIYCETFPDTKMNLLIAHIGNTIKELLEVIRPHILYVPTREDYHQDHIAVNTAVHAAIRDLPIIDLIHEYETSKSMETFSPNYYEVLGAAHVNAKLDAIAKHGSQSIKSYMSDGQAKARLQFRGYQAGRNCMAEAFRTKIISR